MRFMPIPSVKRSFIATFSIAFAAWVAGPAAAQGSGAGRAEALAPAAVRAVPVAQGLENPWALAFLPGAGMVVTERPGRMRLIRPDGQRARAVQRRRRRVERLIDARREVRDGHVHPEGQRFIARPDDHAALPELHPQPR